MRERLMFGPEYVDHGFVFTTELGAPLDLNNLGRGPFCRIMERAGLGTHGERRPKPRHGPRAKAPFKPSHILYALRHTGASCCCPPGCPSRSCQTGSAIRPLSCTDDTYGDLIGDMAEQSAQALDAMFAASSHDVGPLVSCTRGPFYPYDIHSARPNGTAKGSHVNFPLGHICLLNNTFTD